MYSTQAHTHKITGLYVLDADAVDLMLGQRRK